MWRFIEEQFPLEREVQRLTEANLQELFDLVLVKSEFEIHDVRIDILAFDKESDAFVIIEYWNLPLASILALIHRIQIYD